MWSQKTSGRSSVYACRCEEWKENCCGYEWLGRWDGSEGLRGMEEGMHRDLMGWEAPILTRLCYQQNWEDLSFEFEQPRKAPEQGSEILISARKKITVMLMFMKKITHIFCLHTFEKWNSLRNLRCTSWWTLQNPGEWLEKTPRHLQQSCWHLCTCSLTIASNLLLPRTLSSVF